MVFNLVGEWEKDPDFECYLDGEEFRIFRGALTVLCEESTFMCNSLSEKWSSLNLHREPHQMGKVANGSFMFINDAAINTNISTNNESG
jgi:hypothetical protein